MPDGITAKGVDAAIRRLERRIAALADFRPAFVKIERILYDWIRDCFASEGGASDAGPWAALSEDYEAWKERHFPGKTILMASDAMMDSMTGGGNSRVTMTPDTFTAQSTLLVGDWFLASLHQTGTRRMPERSFVMPARIKRQIAGELRRHVRNA